MRDGAYNVKSLRLFIQLSRPIFILNTALLYILGVGIAHYLSGQVDWTLFFLGFSWVILIQLGFQYLNEYFEQDGASGDPSWLHTPFSGGSGAIGTGKLPRLVALWAGLTCLTVTASLTVLMFNNQELSLASVLMLGMILLGELVFALPPIRLVSSGYGEVIRSIITVGFVPALGYLLQGRDVHRLLIMVAFPLAILFLGMILVLELPSYATDIKHERKRATARIGWQKGMLLHNILILSSFIIFGLAFVFCIPLSIGWSVFIVVSIGVFQIWMR